MLADYQIRVFAFDNRKLAEFSILLKKVIGNAVPFLSNFHGKQYRQESLLTIQSSPHVDKKAREQYFYKYACLNVRVRCTYTAYSYILQLLETIGCEVHIIVSRCN